jgi:hypothetical protein
VYIKTKFFLLVCCVLAFISYRQSSAEISITLEATPIIACIGCSISFSVNSGCNLGNATFYWTFGDGSGDTTYVPYTSHAYANPGIFNASVLVVKSGDSGSDDKTVIIFELGSFIIDADRVYDIPGEPNNFHIFAEKIQLKDSDNENWDSLHPRVRYEWYNCADGEYFESGYSSCYTFASVFTFSIFPVVGVNGLVYCEQNPSHYKVSNSVSFYNTMKVY